MCANLVVRQTVVFHNHYTIRRQSCSNLPANGPETVHKHVSRNPFQNIFKNAKIIVGRSFRIAFPQFCPSKIIAADQDRRDVQGLTTCRTTLPAVPWAVREAVPQQGVSCVCRLLSAGRVRRTREAVESSRLTLVRRTRLTCALPWRCKSWTTRIMT